ncbi:MAG: hypothetical protein IJW74_07200 [Oscillospiraceae bacterium]|nr:hypothetical protein [Oscillospiraceae bacterium]
MGVVLWQSIYYFGGETDAEISIVPFGFLIKYISVPEFFINVILGAAFPIYMIFICFKYQHKSFRAKIGFSTWLVGLAVVVVLAESGQRLLDGNMTWTTLIGTFFGFYTGAELLLKNVFPEKETKNGWFLFGIHTLFGIAYIIWLSTGRLYL